MKVIEGMMEKLEESRIELSDAKDKQLEEKNELAMWLFKSMSANHIIKGITPAISNKIDFLKSIENAFENNVDFQCVVSEFLFATAHAIADEDFKLRDKRDANNDNH